MHKLIRNTVFLTHFKKNSYFFSRIDSKPDLYKILNVSPKATQQQIQFNYYKSLGKYEIDGVSDPLVHTKVLNEAYLILSNEKLRKKYD